MNTMIDQIQVSPTVSSVTTEPLVASDLLMALLANSDIRDGIAAGKAFFEEDAEYEEIPQTEDDLIFFVNNELSAQIYRRSRLLSEWAGLAPLPYLHHFGFVMGYLEQKFATQ